MGYNEIWVIMKYEKGCKNNNNVLLFLFTTFYTILRRKRPNGMNEKRCAKIRLDF